MINVRQVVEVKEKISRGGEEVQRHLISQVMNEIKLPMVAQKS